MPHPLRTLSLVSLLALAACGVPERISSIGKPPSLSSIAPVAPAREASIGRPSLTDVAPSDIASGAAFDPVKGNPLAALNPSAAAAAPGGTSLYRTGSRAFFRDQRATNVGDILTVEIEINDRADLGNTTTRTRANSENAGLANILGFETKLAKFLPNAVDPSKLIDGSSASRSTGTGEVQRSEAIDLTVAAIVTGVLPNGNLVIQGRQEVRVNFEKRELLIAGIVRPEDITRLNTIKHTQIAEARIAYGGKGQLTDVQQARYGQQLYDILWPW